MLADSLGPSSEDDLGWAIVQDYLTAFRQHFYGDDVAAAASLHLLVGQLPAVRNMRIQRASGAYIDTRIHCTYLAPSASGKGVIVNFTSRMARRLGVVFKSLDKPTDSALVGTVGENGKVRVGILDRSEGVNVLAMTEAETVLTERPNKEARDVLTIFQKAMNPIGSEDNRVAKRTGMGESVVEPTCSFLFTSYPPHHLTDILLQRGILQRTWLIPRTTSIEDRMRARDFRYGQYFQSADTEIEEDSIARRLREINRYYEDEGYTHLPVTREAIDEMRGATNGLYEMVRNSHPFLQEKFGEFMTRFEDMLLRLAMHYAVLKKHRQIEGEDAYHAGLYGVGTMRAVMSYLETDINIPRDYEQTYARKLRIAKAGYDIVRTRFPSGHGLVPEDELVEASATAASVVPTAAFHSIRYLVAHNVMERKTHRETGTAWVRFRPEHPDAPKMKNENPN